MDWSVTDADLAANTAPLRAPQQHPPLIKEYGARWEPDADAKDYVRLEDGSKVLYSDYQRGRPSLTAQNGHLAPPPVPIPRVPAPSLPWAGDIEPEFELVLKPKRFYGIGRVFKTVWF
ncbi:hypothetical protein C8A05DRAFT_39395, partial [Staphylotrichum tortipilum]